MFRSLLKLKPLYCSSFPHCLRTRQTYSLFCHLNINRNRLSEDIDFSTSLTRAPFEELSRVFSLDLVEKFLQDSKIDKLNVYETLFVGGSTPIAHIVKLADLFNGKGPSKSINPDEAVAYGSAVQPPSSPARPLRRLRIFFSRLPPLSLGIETAGCVIPLM